VTSGCKYLQTQGNAFDDLRRREEADYHCDMVILDPPAFTKNRAGADSAARGYNEINRRAMKLLRPGGVLVTCSCTHHIDADEFAAIVAMAGRDAKKELRIIERRGQGPDHPILFSVPETDYLKCLVLSVI
jgi:23S rRNA (cytosine1962-C5)-methyltransferase